MTFFSICSPVYEMGGRGSEVLEYSFRKLEEQTFKDFEVIIADHSADNDFKIENLCYNWHNRLNIFHYRNQDNRGSPAANTNFAMSKATGKYIKILCQDDALLNENSLQLIYDEIDENYNWFCSPYLHTWDRQHFFNPHVPIVNPKIYLINTIGTPSCVTIKNSKNLPQMDTNLIYCYDEEWYARVIQFYGLPKITKEFTMMNFLWENSITSKITPEFIKKEEEYILEKYGKN